MNLRKLGRLTACALFLSIHAFAQHSLLWEVSGNGLKQPSYLFGTYHILKDSYLNHTPNVRKAYEQAGGVAVEMVIDSSKLMMVATRALMLDTSLPKLLSATDYQTVAREFKAVTGYDLSLFNQMKPVMTATLLSMAYIERDADTLKRFTGQPLDLYFADNARKQGKPVSGLETMEEQIALLYDSEPVQKQAERLIEMVTKKDSTEQLSKTITDLYLKQDLAGMWKLSELTGPQAGDMSALVDNRNRNWLKKLPALMATRPTFIAVGALHLPGPNGLIALLKKAGYQLRGI